MNNITAEYSQNSSTEFIIDKSNDWDEFSCMKLDYDRIFLVIDENVEKLYGSKILEKIKNGKREIFIHTVEPKEESKSILYYPVLIDFFERNGAGRYDAVLAVGGGIVIDLVSFTVSTYMRGLPLYIIASTLIGQTDATTAGKTCLNSNNSKNLLGTFFYPKQVYNNISIMETCPKRITRQGLSEAFKYSLLTDGELLEDIIKYQNGEYNPELMEKIVRYTINARIAVRKVDPLASNLGHTFGHAMEKYFEYKILHGDAILAGTVMAINYAVYKGIMEPEEKDKIFDMMKQAHLNIYISSNMDTDRLVELMKKDKKSSSKELHLVMIEAIGKPYRCNTPFFEADYQDVKGFLKNFVNVYQYRKENYDEFLMSDCL